MRISDWSSDVCSSDLQVAAGAREAVAREAGEVALDAIEWRMEQLQPVAHVGLRLQPRLKMTPLHQLDLQAAGLLAGGERGFGRLQRRFEFADPVVTGIVVLGARKSVGAGKGGEG